MTDQAELLRKAGELMDWVKNDRFAQQAVMKVIANRGYASAGEMASKDPKTFLELHAAIGLMREELPWT